MCMNSADADYQAFRHLRVGETVGDEREHLELPAGQALRPIYDGVPPSRSDQFDRVSEGSLLPSSQAAAKRVSPSSRCISASTRS